MASGLVHAVVVFLSLGLEHYDVSRSYLAYATANFGLALGSAMRVNRLRFVPDGNR